MSVSFFKRWAMSSKTFEEGFRQCFKKSSYRTEEIAKAYLEKAKQKSGHDLRIYKCNICHQYHLTHKEKRGS
jgi:hypothetical protein